MFKLRFLFIVVCFSHAILFAQEKQDANQAADYVVLTDVDGNSYSGSILYLAGDQLVFWNSPQSYNKDKLKEKAFTISGEDIERITIIHDEGFLSGMGYGFLAGTISGTVTSLSGTSNNSNKNIFAVVSSLGGALIGGLIGMNEGQDEDFIISGKNENFSSISKILKTNAIFPEHPPIEISLLVN